MNNEKRTRTQIYFLKEETKACIIYPTKMGRSKRKHKVVDVEKEDLGRFAGSSDEEEEEPIRQQKMNDAGAHADDEDNKDDAGEDSSKQLDKDSDGDDDDLISDDDGEALEPEVGPESSSAKMSNAMARILGTTTHKKSATSSVVLSKTTTPLQRMQMKEKEQAKELREKRRQNRERSLTALHIPLSVATTNTIDTGRNSVAKELEQERFHRRVATRGVVALFNAITQHQKSSEVRLFLFFISFTIKVYTHISFFCEIEQLGRSRWY